MTDIVLSAAERDLLLWLNEEAFSQYGECHGDAFEKLVSLGLAQVHGPGEHQEGFAASEPDGTKPSYLMFRAVSLTPGGRRLAAEMKA